MAYEHTVHVRFYEIDRAGIAFFGRVFEYCHQAFEELLAEIVGDLETFFQTSPWMMPLVRSEADFMAPMRLGDTLLIRVEVERVGAKSVTFAYTLTGQDGVLRARARLVHVVTDRATFRGTPVPAALREGLARVVG